MIQNKLTVWIWGIVLCFSSCTDYSRYEEALPADAAMVTSIDLTALAEKAGLTEMNSSSFQTWCKRMLGKDAGEVNHLLDKWWKEPESSGLDLTKRVYLFVAPETEYMGMLLRVHSRKKLEMLVETLRTQQLCEEVNQSEGVSWTVSGNYLAAWSDEAFLVMTSPGREAPRTLQRKACRLLGQEVEESFLSRPDCARLKKAGGDFAVISSLNVLPLQYVLPFTMGMSGEMKLKDIKGITSISFEPGKAVVEVDALVDDGVAQKWISRNLEATSPLKGTFLECFPKSYGGWLSFNADGKQIYRLITEHSALRRKLEHSMIPIDFESVFSAVKGDVAIAMPDCFRSKSFIAYAEVTDTGFLQTLEDLKPILNLTGGQAVLVDAGEHAYEFHAADASLLGLPAAPLTLWMGVKGHYAYLTNDRQLLHTKVLGLSLRHTPWGERTEGRRMMAALRIDEVFQGGEYLTIESVDGTGFRLECTLKDGKTNALRQLANLLGLW